MSRIGLTLRRIACLFTGFDPGDDTAEVMKKPTQTRRLLAFLVLWAAGVGMLHADDRFLWRSWGVRDGFTETYSYAVSRTPEGSAYVRHGAVSSMSLFDGYGVTRIPEPHGNAQPYWPSTKRVYAATGGSLWTTSLDALKEYRDGEWTVRYTASGRSPRAGRRAGRTAGDGAHGRRTAGVRPGASKLARNPYGAGFQNCAFPGNVSGFRRTNCTSRANTGWRSCVFRAKAALSSGMKSTATSYRLTHFDYPLPGSGELFAQGISSRDKRRVIVRWSGTGLESVYAAAADNLRGWQRRRWQRVDRGRGGDFPLSGRTEVPRGKDRSSHAAPSSTFIPRKVTHFG